MSAAYLSIDRIVKRFGSSTALADVSLGVDRGEFVTLLGPSGCGKTTLLKIIAGLERADGGSLSLMGHRLDAIPTWKRDIGIVFQSYALFPHMSVEANIRFGLDMRGIKGEEAADMTADALRLVKLEGYGARRPSELSGGQQQRVAIARALVVKPRLLLLDEPLSNLDAVLRKSVRVDIRELHERVGLTTIMVTHDQEEAMSMSDRVVVMSGGHIQQYDRPDVIYERPATRFVASFVGNPPAVLLPFSLGADAVEIAGRRLPRTGAFGALPDTLSDRALEIGFRGDHLFLSQAGPETLSGIVTSSEYVGGGFLVHIALDDARLTVPLAEMPPANGTTAHVGFRPLVPMLYDAASGERVSL